MFSASKGVESGVYGPAVVVVVVPVKTVVGDAVVVAVGGGGVVECIGLSFISTVLTEAYGEGDGKPE